MFNSWYRHVVGKNWLKNLEYSLWITLTDNASHMRSFSVYISSSQSQADTTANRLVSQMRATLAASREPAGKLWQLCKVLYVFEQKTQYILIHAQFTRIVICWHIGNVPQWFRRVKLLLYSHVLYSSNICEILL